MSYKINAVLGLIIILIISIMNLLFPEQVLEAWQKNQKSLVRLTTNDKTIILLFIRVTGVILLFVFIIAVIIFIQ